MLSLIWGVWLRVHKFDYNLDVLEKIKNIYADEGITNARNYYTTLKSENDRKLCEDYMNNLLVKEKIIKEKA